MDGEWFFFLSDGDGRGNYLPINLYIRTYIRGTQTHREKGTLTQHNSMAINGIDKCNARGTHFTFLLFAIV